MLVTFIIDTKLQSHVIIIEAGKIVQKRSSHTGNLGRQRNENFFRDSAAMEYPSILGRYFLEIVIY